METKTRKTKPKPSVVTVSGYPVKDVCNEIEAAIERGDAESACCLASELVLSGMHVALVTLLTNVFAMWYVSVDATSMTRMYAAFDMMTRGLPDGIEARRALVQVVVSMALGLPRQNAFEHVALRAGSHTDSNDDDTDDTNKANTTTTLIGQTTRLYSVMQSGKGQDVARLVSRVLRDCSGGGSGGAAPIPASVVSLAFCAIWDACTRAVDVCDELDWRRTYVASAHRMFCDCNATSSKAVCLKRRNIAVCAVLVAASAAAGVKLSDAPMPRCTWRGANADTALSQAYRNMDAIFKTEDDGYEGDDDERDGGRDGAAGAGGANINPTATETKNTAAAPMPKTIVFRN
ncbi:hypothetical protein FOA52_001602 [Chlamydomonas sp. UWO 241]|nr:hypothetical protein FOA52_001602 [Chlamydomonas sp. UWO 241]